MRRLLSLSEAAKIKGVSISTLRRWEGEGKLIPQRTENGHRRYDLHQLLNVSDTSKLTLVQRGRNNPPVQVASG
jgi:DNA-binding transcriptional MerR regulator